MFHSFLGCQAAQCACKNVALQVEEHVSAGCSSMTAGACMSRSLV